MSQYSFLKVAALLLLACSVSLGLRAADAVPVPAKLIAESGDERGGPGGGKMKPLAEFLPGTKWLMYGRQDRVLEFCKGGKFDLADWTKQGIAAVWKVTGPNRVTVTVISRKFRNLTAVFDFDEERTFFTGHDLDKKRQVTKSPRAPEDDRKLPGPDEAFRRPF